MAFCATFEGIVWVHSLWCWTYELILQEPQLLLLEQLLLKVDLNWGSKFLSENLQGENYLQVDTARNSLFLSPL